MRDTHPSKIVATYTALASLILAMACTSTGESDPSQAERGGGGTTGDGEVGTGGAGGGTGGNGGNIAAVPCPDAVLSEASAVRYLCNCGTDAHPACVAGDDSADGLTADTPWQTYEAAREAFGELPAGGAIAFCRGGSFTAAPPARWVNAACRADEPCLVRDYEPPWATGDEDKPVLHSPSGVFNLEDPGNANHEEGYVFMGLSLRGQGQGTAVAARGDVDDVLLCDLDIDGFHLGVHVAGSGTPDPDSDGKNSRIVLRNSNVRNNDGQGWLGSCDECAIEYSRFDNNGFEKAILSHNIYVSGSSGSESQDMRIVGNHLTNSAIVDGQCSGVSLVVHGHQRGLLIAGNHIEENIGEVTNGCWGIAVDTGYSGGGEAFFDVTIRGNTVVNVGRLAIGLNACQNCVIENNVIIHQQALGGARIAAPNRDRDETDLPMSGIVVRNNSIYLGPDADGTGLRLGGEGAGHVAVSNAIQYAGSGSFACFDLTLPSADYEAVDHNLCWTPRAPGAAWNAGSDLASWQASSSLDGNSLVADPEWSAIGPSFELWPSSSGSPLVDAGAPSHSARIDFMGESRDVEPDIGAYELQ